MRCKFEIFSRLGLGGEYDLEKESKWIDNHIEGVCSGFGYEMTNNLVKSKEFTLGNAKFKTSIVKGV